MVKLFREPNLDIESEPVNHHSCQTLQSFGQVQRQRKPATESRVKTVYIIR